MTKPAGMQADGSETRRPIRFVTASALFDGHDASINLIRRLLQAAGAEVIHLGHNRSAEEIVSAAIQEDAAAIAVSSYQGGHVEFLRYMADLLREREAAHIRIFAGGGGAITPEEAEQSATYGVSKIFTPEDGRTLGLEGMIAWMLRESDCEMAIDPARELERLKERDPSALALLVTAAEANGSAAWLADIREQLPHGVPVIGITGTGGAGKSSLTDELVRRFLREKAAGTIAVISVDPTRQKTGGALLGDRIRMNAIGDGRTYMRSMATRGSGKELSAATSDAVALAKHAGFDWIIVETSGIGQGDSAITRLCDIAVYVMTSEYGAPSQLEKIDMLDYADMIVVNKFDRAGSEDALRDVRKQYRRSRGMGTDIADEELPVYGTIASRFGDLATDALFRDIAEAAERYVRNALKPASRSPLIPEPQSPAYDARIAPKWLKLSLPGSIIPRERSGYLGEIVETLRERRTFVEEQAELARRIGKLRGARMLVKANGGSFLLREAASGQSGQGTRSQARDASQAPPIAAQFPDAAISRPAAEQGGAMPPLAAQSPDAVESPPVVLEADGSPAGQSNLAQADTGQIAVLLEAMAAELELQLHPSCKKLLDEWPALREGYGVGAKKFQDAGPATANPSSPGSTAAKPPQARLHWTTLSGLTLPRIALPRYSCPGDLLRWLLTENVPGKPPYTAGVFPLKRSDEEPKRQFAGEGTPERTNRRFHYLSRHDNAKRLSVAFDSVTLYGHDPGERPDIYGKIGNSGVNVPTLDDMERLFRGFDLCHPATSVSMTINGPAPILLAMYMNTAIRQQLAKFAAQHGRKPDAAEEEAIRTRTMQTVRGTVQADILKEDQGQNTCIFSTGFALKMMGDIQQYFIDHGVRHYYSVSISGYHIAEAGANPISQLAFTLANGFTYVEYYRSRGMAVDEFAPNLSFFFSNGLDPEYAVLGRVARRIWSTVIRHKYGGNERSQKLKYHIQTSGRSLHAQEMDFNDIRTTLQALLAIYDNCNSLHTNAYDEAITTPTEHSVRRAMAIQLIINKEFGFARNDNPLQGSFLIEELTDLVEEAVLAELGRIHHRGGVLGAMDTGYQRGRIQEESMLYESLKHSGELPIVGVNTFLNTNPAAALASDPELARSTTEEKETQLANLRTFREKHGAAAKEALERLKQAALGGGNVFEELMETVQVATLGQITTALFEVGGQYRRNM
ncbi:methylmalonyl-CoA mutase family protein [Paenibacillus agaridevorans]|uniref:methylmalonyl-CoA mutase family protein n=1 Tax=Paenibacillus agaridevorans TaxID=171404 RepID=UPI001FE4081E|nr:methylmalonyl-CoA mutase family protein [Paenibacillus agaridevorans]